MGGLRYSCFFESEKKICKLVQKVESKVQKLKGSKVQVNSKSFKVQSLMFKGTSGVQRFKCSINLIQKM